MMKGFASDYIKSKRQNAIYLNMHSNAETTGNTTNPLKWNGFYYNNMLNVCVPKNCSKNNCTGGVLTNARSYQLRLDFKQGKYYNDYICNCNKEQIYEVTNVCDTTGCSTCNVKQIDGQNVVANCLCSPCAFT